MEQIESYRQFGSIVREFKKAVGAVNSNCYFLPNDVKKMTEKGTLFLDQTADCLYFFVNEAECSRLYYYLKDGAVPCVKRQKKPVFLDFVFRETEGSQKNQEIELWEKQGFQVYKSYRRMECCARDFLPPADQKEMEQKYPMENLVPEDYEDCIALWENGLDVFSTLLPDREEFTEACRKGQVFGIRRKDGSVGGADRGIDKGRTAFMQHLSVSPELRGTGIGRTLCCASIAAMFTQHGAEKVNFWVDAKNNHAIGIYKRMGFVDDGMVSGQLKLESEEN